MAFSRPIFEYGTWSTGIPHNPTVEYWKYESLGSKWRIDVFFYYCWWKKSCTTWVGKNLINNGITENHHPWWCRIFSINSSNLSIWKPTKTWEFCAIFNQSNLIRTEGPHQATWLFIRSPEWHSWLSFGPYPPTIVLGEKNLVWKEESKNESMQIISLPDILSAICGDLLMATRNPKANHLLMYPKPCKQCDKLPTATG